VSVADLTPDAAGVKVTLIVQDSFNKSVVPQVVADSEKSPEFVPLITVEDIVTTAPVLLVSVTFLVALVLSMP
jgi:hypothetical protein